MTTAIKELNALLLGVDTVEDLLAHSSACIARALRLDLVSIFVSLRGQSFSFEYNALEEQGNARPNTSLRFASGQVLLGNQPVALPVFLKKAQTSDLAQNLKRPGSSSIQSLCIVPLLHFGTLIGWLEGQTFSIHQAWTVEQKEELENIGNLLVESLQHSLPATSSEPDDLEPTAGGKDQDSLPWVILDILDDGRIVRSSARLQELVGIDAALARTITLHDLLNQILSDELKELAYQQINDVLARRIDKTELFVTAKHVETGASKTLQLRVERSWPKSRRLIVVLTDISNNRTYRERLDEAKLRSMRLVEFGNLIIIRTGTDLQILDVLGDTRKVFGVPARELMNKPDIWNKVLSTDDFRRLALKIRTMGEHPIEFEQEIELHDLTRDTIHHLFLTAVPIFSEEGRHIGWEGYGLDISEKRKVEQELQRQARRIQALYEIARTMQTNIDPAFVALHGLKALMSATKSVFGHCVIYDRSTDQMEILATVGCDAEFVDGLSKIMAKPNLSRDVITNNCGLLIDDLRQSRQARYGIAARAGARACIAMPLSYEDANEGTVVIGALQIASRRIGKYTQEDYDLVSAAAAQMAASIRQAEFNASEKREASSLATLYRLSHSLSKVQQLEQIAEQSFPVILSELACKRLWLGIINDQGTHIAGVGAYGPGLHDRIARVQIELSLRHDFIDQAINTKQAVIVPANTDMECSALNNIVERLKLGTLVIVPLVVIGQVVGVLVLEPNLASPAFLSRKLSLLTSMANEMATVVMTRRLEGKIAASEKMRMAGLLASGVAHNFNNLLQAVMGQASLISMQTPASSPIKKAADTITEAAVRGADLIKKMLSLSESSPAGRVELGTQEFLETSRDFLTSLAGKDIELRLDIGEQLPKIIADSRQLQQVLSSLVVNAREALAKQSNGKIEIRAYKKRLRTAELDPELVPGEYLVISVGDNGIGMQAEQINRCFEPFYSSKNIDQRTGVAFDGSGFGLSLSYSIIRQHGGTILVSSQAGVGTEFNIYIPAAVKLAVPALSDRMQIEKVVESQPVGTNDQLTSKPSKDINSGKVHE